MTFETFLAEIRNDLQKFNSAGLLDELTILNQVNRSLNRFNTLPTDTYQRVFHVHNGRVALPTGFKKLQLAIKCDPYQMEHPKGRDILLDTFFWKATSKISGEWNQCTECDITFKEECVTEKFYLHTSPDPVKFHYNNPQILTLTPGINKSYCTEGCPNIYADCPYEINIVGGAEQKMLQANFQEGNIFVEYLALPHDEQGFPIIPETSTMYLESYVEYAVKRKIMENIFSNGDYESSDGVGDLLSYFKAEERNFFSLAMTELKFNGLSFGIESYVQAYRREFDVFNY